MQDNFYKKIGILFGAGIMVILVIFLGIIPLINYLLRPGYVEVLVAPVGAEITIEGQAYHNGVYELAPREYTATISLEGFETQTLAITIKRGELSKLYTYLTPTDKDYSFYEKRANMESLEALIKIAGDNQPKFLQKLMLVDEGEIAFSACDGEATRTNCDSVKVKYGYERECGWQLCLKITGRRTELTNGVLDEVKRELALKGYDLNDYKYIYERVDN